MKGKEEIIMERSCSNTSCSKESCEGCPSSQAGQGPESFLVEGACCPTLSVMPYPGFFLSASPSARQACAQKQNACTRQAFDIRAVHHRTTMGTGTQFREKCFRDWTGDWGRRESFCKNALFFPPAGTPAKNHASTGRRASMAALSRTRWLELPRKSSSRSRRAST